MREAGAGERGVERDGIEGVEEPRVNLDGLFGRLGLRFLDGLLLQRRVGRVVPVRAPFDVLDVFRVLNVLEKGDVVVRTVREDPSAFWRSQAIGSKLDSQFAHLVNVDTEDLALLRGAQAQARDVVHDDDDHEGDTERV